MRRRRVLSLWLLPCVLALRILGATVAAAQTESLTREEQAGEEEALRAIGTHSTNADLIQLIGASPNKYVRGIAAKWLGDRHAAEARDVLFEAMSDSEIYVQRRAAVAFARVSDCQIPDRLVQQLGARRAETRLVTIGAILELIDPGRCGHVANDAARVMPFFASLILDPSADVRREAIVLLNRIGATADEAQRIELLTRAMDDRDATVQLEAIRALQGTQDKSVVDKLVALLEDPNPLVMREAVKALAASGSSEAMRAVSDLLTHRDPEFRVSAVRALVELRAPRAAQDLSLMLDDRSSLVRFEAVKGLAELRPPNVAELLIPMLDDTDAQVRVMAARAFSEICPRDDVAAARALAEAAADPNQSVALHAIAGLRCMRSEENVPELIDALCRASNRDVRAGLVRLLESTTHSRPGESCSDWRNWLQKDGVAWQHREDSGAARE